MLRRRLLNVLLNQPDTEGQSLHVYVGSASAGFIKGLGIPVDAHVYTSKTVWLLAMVMNTLQRRPPVLVFNPGEVQLNLKTTVAYMSLWVPAAIIRLRGGAVVRTGTALDNRVTQPIAVLAKLAVRVANLATSIGSWRDVASRDEFGAGRLVPDWAIEKPSEDKDGYRRTLLAVTYRSDRRHAFDEYAIKRIREMAERYELKVIVYCQVRRDQVAMQKLAKDQGWEYIAWASTTPHLEQEIIVRDLLKKSRFVCSNRIHALIIGLTEGAQAICISSDDEHKVRTHLEYFGLTTMILSNPIEDSLDFNAVVPQRNESAEALANASAVVADLSRHVSTSVRQIKELEHRDGNKSGLVTEISIRKNHEN